MTAPLDAIFAGRAHLPWLRERTILLARHGSHAYGLTTPTSDEDFKGVAVPPRAYFLGFANAFEQAESAEPDLIIYEIRKFFRLARDGNPNLIEVLYADPADHLVRTPAGDRLIESRDLFLSRKARHTFSGYAVAQLKRLSAHQRWLRDPPAAPPRREDFGLPPAGEAAGAEREPIGRALADLERELAAREGDARADFDSDADPATPARDVASGAATPARDVASGAAPAAPRPPAERHAGPPAPAAPGPPPAERHAARPAGPDTALEHAGRRLGHGDEALALLQAERDYRARKHEWDAYRAWLANRNEARAALEARFGYDVKHAMHVVRLLRMCREILESGRVVVKRPDRDELLAVRAGAWPYERLVAWAAEEDRAMGELYERSPLPRAPDTKALDALCVAIVEASLSAG